MQKVRITTAGKAKILDFSSVFGNDESTYHPHTKIEINPKKTREVSYLVFTGETGKKKRSIQCIKLEDIDPTKGSDIAYFHKFFKENMREPTRTEWQKRPGRTKHERKK